VQILQSDHNLWSSVFLWFIVDCRISVPCKMGDQLNSFRAEGLAQEPATQTSPPVSNGVAHRPGDFTEEWQHGLFSCFSPTGLCLKAHFCPCFVFGKTQARLRDPSMRSYEAVNADCLLYCGLGWAYQFLKRKEMRERYNIGGTDLKDCMVSWCCHCPSLIQMEKEVVARQGQEHVNSQGYVAPQHGMTYGEKEYQQHNHH